MIGIAIDRQNKAHLIDYTHHNGNKYAVCGYVYRANEVVNTFELDGTIPGICRSCRDAYEVMYIDDLNGEVRTARGGLFEKRRKRYLDIQRRHRATNTKYWFLAYRDWERFDTYRFLVTRNPNARKYGSSRKYK